jgi:hypothetical protein
VNQFAPGVILNERPRPRVVVKFSTKEHQDQWVEALGALFETVQPINDDDAINWGEFDCLFTDDAHLTFRYTTRGGGWRFRYPEHINVFLLVNDADGSVNLVYSPATQREFGNPLGTIGIRHGVVGSHIRRVDGLDDRIAAAIDMDLAPVVKEFDRHTVFRTDDPSRFEFRPLLLGPNNGPLAITAVLSHGASLWVLPNFFPILPMNLVRAAYREWSVSDSARFPALPDWEGDSSYFTAKELEIAARIEAEDARFAALRAQHSESAAALAEELALARDEADAGTRALLTADGSVLASAVLSALVTLGFHCRDMDDEFPESHREDLRVSDGDDPDWEAIAEVKGYSKGAKVDIIQQANRHARIYAAENGRNPTVWMIVNAQRRQSPETREKPFTSRADEMAVVEDSGDMVLDSRVLFELVRRVEAGSLDPQKARSWLRGSSGVVWQLPVDLL